MADSFIINKSGSSFDFSVSFDKTNNLLKNATISTNFNSNKIGEDVIITIPADLAANAWQRCIYSLELDANYMYMLIAKNSYNGFGRLGITHVKNTPPF